MSKNTAARIVDLVTGVTRDWTKQRKAEERDASRVLYRRDRLVRQRQETIKDVAWNVMERAYLKASDNGSLPANARQIMYAARDEIQRRVGKALKSTYFTQVLLPDYVEKYSPDWDVVFDDRGHFKEPHTGYSIGIGTIAVRDYLHGRHEPTIVAPKVSASGGAVVTRGAIGRYGALFFIEKEGFDPLLERVQLSKRYDIATMSTKGLSVTAARLLADQICHQAGIPLMVLHDFDKSGFSIIGMFQHDNRRYTFQNQIKVIDLGLRLKDVRELGIEHLAEDIFDTDDPYTRKQNMLKNGATEEEVNFLLTKRVELNALTSRQLVALIERKLRNHGITKVVPDLETLGSAYRAFSRSVQIREVIKKYFKIMKLDKGPAIEVPMDLATQVQERLQRNPTLSWDEALKNLVEGD